ncbi:unnamed protein product [Pleuronectes platessa]|uniref:Uncharacterized protein n=1 Tax=Pleuronectes platessa TaxID=8262 RepID=A0A9N7UKI5_PLEPL|nr:unnamed protein product [Pleuronectes platessa]
MRRSCLFPEREDSQNAPGEESTSCSPAARRLNVRLGLEPAERRTQSQTVITKLNAGERPRDERRSDCRKQEVVSIREINQKQIQRGCVSDPPAFGSVAEVDRSQLQARSGRRPLGAVGGAASCCFQGETRTETLLRPL